MTTAPAPPPVGDLPWDRARREVREVEWRAALEAAGGNITAAARAVGISRRHASNLVRTYALHAWAAELRRARYQREKDRGRPAVTTKKTGGSA